MSQQHWDGGFVHAVRIHITNTAKERGRLVQHDDFIECGTGVVAAANCFFFDPKRWRFTEKGVSYSTNAPVVEVRREELNDVSDVVAYAREKLTPRRKSDARWREDIFEKEG